MMMRIEPTLREKKQASFAWMFGRTCRLCIVAVSISFGVLYVLQTSVSASTGYEVSDLQRRVQSLERENGSLDVRIAEYRSMESIQERLVHMDMVPVSEISYTMPVGTAVARR